MMKGLSSDADFRPTSCGRKSYFVASGKGFPYVESGLRIHNAGSAPLKNRKNVFTSQTIASIDKNI
jgi:hypothetical protein